MYHMSKTFSASFYLFLAGGLLLANAALYRAIFAPRALQVQVLDVGKGDATLVRTPRGQTLLIDTGPDASILRALGTALPPWERTIDAIVLTSSKTSSIGGLPEVEDRYHTPSPMRSGESDSPFGTSFTFDTDTSVAVISPGIFSISYGAASLLISSSTPTGGYVSDGKQFTKNEQPGA